MNVRDLLFVLLRNAIKGEALDVSAVKESLSENKVATLFKVAKEHDVAHLLAYAIEKNGLLLKEELKELFSKELEQARLRYEMIQADTNEICSCFEKEGIEYIPLKGAVIRSFYPEPWMRTSCDVDILIKKEKLDRAINALTQDYNYKTDRKITYHDVSLYSPFGMHLELHFNIKENIAKYDEILTQVWTFSHAQVESSVKMLQETEFLIFHITAHLAYHFVSGGCGVRSVLDLWILNQRLDVQKSKLDELLEKAGLLKFYYSILKLGEYWFGKLENPRNYILEAEKFVLLGGAYGTSNQSILTGRAKKGGRLKYIFSRIFMPYENLAVLYPIIKKHKVLTPFCQIARWFSALGKKKKINKELSSLSKIDKEKLEKTETLLNNLGL